MTEETLVQYKKRIKEEILQAIKDCKKEKILKKEIGNGSPEHYEIDLDGKIYAYEFVIDCLIDS